MESIGDLIGWMFLFVFGIWIGSIINTFYIKKIYEEIRNLNGRSGGEARPLIFNNLKADEEARPKIFNNSNMKYCEKCSSSTEMHLTECRNCYGTSFVHKRPDAQK